VTYLNQLAHPTNSVARGALLLGEWVTYDKEEVLYISAAVEADNLSFDMSEVTFDKDTWTGLYDSINRYFEDISVVGWFLSRLGYTTKVTDAMQEQHRKNFKGDKTVLYLMDALEQEDTFYLQLNDKLVAQSGYYIYYERNTPMQNYLIEHQSGGDVVTDKRIEYKDGQLLHSYHEILAGRQGRKEEKRITGMLYATSAMLVIVFLALAISIFNNYDRMQNLQTSIDRLLGTDVARADDADGVVPTEVSVIVGENSGYQDSADAATTEQVSAEVAEDSPGDSLANADTDDSVMDTGGAEGDDVSDTVSDETADGSATDESSVPTEQADDDATVSAASMSNLNYYTVQPGDTLLTISQQIYHSDAYVDTLREANEIGEYDYIYPGQQIVIPVVQ
jgi:LysM repeat protein